MRFSFENTVGYFEECYFVFIRLWGYILFSFWQTTLKVLTYNFKKYSVDKIYFYGFECSIFLFLTFENSFMFWNTDWNRIALWKFNGMKKIILKSEILNYLVEFIIENIKVFFFQFFYIKNTYACKLGRISIKFNSRNKKYFLKLLNEFEKISFWFYISREIYIIYFDYMEKFNGIVSEMGEYNAWR